MAINSRNINDLTPVVANKCRQWLTACHDAGLSVQVISTYRDYAEQGRLYAQGRTTPGKIVTNAKPGYSYHNFKVAWDFVVLVDGKAHWSDDTGLYTKAGEIAESIGIEWAGRWHSFKETGHLQVTGGKQLEDYRIDEAGKHER